MTKKIRISILGCGRMGRRHAAAYKNHPHVEIKGFYDIETAMAKRIAAHYKARVYKSVEDVMMDSEIDALSICTPNALHFDLLMAGIKSDKNILVEKPIVTTIEHCNSVLQLMKRSSSKIMVGHVERFFPCNIALKSVIDSESIGKPLIINTFDYIPGRNPGENMPEWVKMRRLSGGGVFMTDLVHTVDKITWLMNSPIKKVYTPLLSDSITNSDTEDVGIATLWLKNGVTASCIVCCPSPGRWDKSTKIVGTNGEVKLEFGKNLEIYKQSVRSVNYEYRGQYIRHSNAGFAAEIDEFIKSILHNREPKINFIDGINAVKTILMLYESFKNKKPVVMKN